MTSHPTHGLREQKKARTRDELVEAAYAVVRDDGIAGLTAEAIAARAGVSRRTFFNYFPSVGSVLAAGVADFFVGLAGGLDARPAGEPLLDSLESLIATPADPRMFERIAALGRVGLGSEEARAAMQGVLHDWLPWLIELFRGRLHPDVDRAAGRLGGALATDPGHRRVVRGRGLGPRGPQTRAARGRGGP